MDSETRKALERMDGYDYHELGEALGMLPSEAKAWEIFSA